MISSSISDSFTDFKIAMNGLKKYECLMLVLDKDTICKMLNNTNNTNNEKFIVNTSQISIKAMRYENLKLSPEEHLTVLIGKNDVENAKIACKLLHYHQHTINEILVISKHSTVNYSMNVKNIFNIEKGNEMLKKIVARELSPQLLIIDNCFKELLHMNGLLETLIVNGKHHKIHVMIVDVDILTITGLIRNNMSRLIVGNYEYKSDLQKLYDRFFSMIPDYQTFRQLFQNLTEGDEYMVHNLCNKSNDTDTNVFSHIYWFDHKKYVFDDSFPKMYNGYSQYNIKEDEESNDSDNTDDDNESLDSQERISLLKCMSMMDKKINELTEKLDKLIELQSQNQ